MRAAPYLFLVPLMSASALAQTAPTVDGFDYPVRSNSGDFTVTATCDGDGWYVYQNFQDPFYYDCQGNQTGALGTHTGEDWNGEGGGNSDCGEPIYSTAKGTVIEAANFPGGQHPWGNVVIIRHDLPDGSQVESLYAHLDSILVQKNHPVSRNQQIGTLGDANPPCCAACPGPDESTGYYARLHFAIRRSNSPFWGTPGPGYAANPIGYLDPSDFIDANRIRSVVTWGRNDFDLGNVPSPNTRFVAVAGGYAHSLGLKADGSIVAWGAHIDVPLPNTGFVGVSTRDYHSLGLKADGSIVAWGCPADQNYGQCDVPSPNAGFVAVAAGHSHSVGLKDDGSIVAWGANWSGQAELPSPNVGFVGIAAGCWHNVALRSDGSTVSWGCGANVNFGQCDDPIPNTGFVRIAAGCWHSLGLTTDGSIVAWGCGGSQDFGQCSVSEADTRFVQVAGGLAYTLGLKADGSIQVWGCGDRYSPSYGTCNMPSPNTGFVAIEAGAYHGLGIKGTNVDFDGDGDADLSDYAAFVIHMNGPYADPSVNRWRLLDVDPDYDVDLRDFAKFQTLFAPPP